MLIKYLLPVCLIFFVRPVEALDNPALMYKRGVKYAQEGDIEKAITSFKEAVAASPYFCLAHYGLGKAYLYRDHTISEAVLHLKRATELDDSFAKGYFYLGIAYLFEQKYTRSVRAFRNAYTLDNQMIEALFNIYVVYDIIEQRVKALQYYRLYLQAKQKKEDGSLFFE